MDFGALIAWIQSIWDSFKPIIFIMEFQQGVLYRRGVLVKVLDPGWHFKIPFLDEYSTENVKGDTLDIPPISLTTLDNKTVSIGCEFDFTITDVIKSLVDTNDWRSNLTDICRGILSDQLEDSNWDDIRKKVVKNQISKRIEKRAEEMGVTISNFNFTDKCVTKSLTLFKGL